MIARGAAITWDYDEDVDVLCLSVGEPRPAVGMDIGDGVIVRYDEGRREVVGLTLLGLRSRLMGESVRCLWDIIAFAIVAECVLTWSNQAPAREERGVGE